MGTFVGPAAVVTVNPLVQYQVNDANGKGVATFFDPVLAQGFAEWITERNRATSPRKVEYLDESCRNSVWKRRVTSTLYRWNSEGSFWENNANRLASQWDQYFCEVPGLGDDNLGVKSGNTGFVEVK